MRVLQFVLLTLIAAFPDDVLSNRNSQKKNLGPCGKPFLRQIKSKCYYISAKKMNWFGALNNCLRKGLSLANLATRQEVEQVMEFLGSRRNMEDFWFGGNDLQTEGRFTYISNGQPVEFHGIEATLRANSDDCLELRLRVNGTMITDENCYETQYFICEDINQKCAQPVIETGNDHHSHEHLHHFHHDAAKDEADGEKGSKESMESDSRPIDNTNSTEEAKSAEVAADEGDNQSKADENGDNANNPPDEKPAIIKPPKRRHLIIEDPNETTPAAADGDATKAAAADEAATTAAPAEGAATTAAAADEATTTAAAADGDATTAAPA
ncbi:hypothetical protein KR093_004795, partial [Drosophila rubida]